MDRVYWFSLGFLRALGGPGSSLGVTGVDGVESVLPFSAFPTPTWFHLRKSFLLLTHLTARSLDRVSYSVSLRFDNPQAALWAENWAQAQLALISREA